jgi:hypothetical protein
MLNFQMGKNLWEGGGYKEIIEISFKALITADVLLLIQIKKGKKNERK